MAHQVRRTLGSVVRGVLQQRFGPAFTAPVRVVLHAWNQGPEPDQADWQWLGAESAAAALAESGPDEALCRIWESLRGDGLDGRLAAVRATGHPGAEKLARAVAGFVASGDSPIEYPSEEDPQEPGPFGLTEVNRKLAKLGGG